MILWIISGLNQQKTISRGITEHMDWILCSTCCGCWETITTCLCASVCFWEDFVPQSNRSYLSPLWVDIQRRVSSGITCGVGNCFLFPLLKTVLLSFSLTQSTMRCPPPASFMTQPSSRSLPTQLANPSTSFLVNPAPHQSLMTPMPSLAVTSSTCRHVPFSWELSLSLQTFCLPLHNSLNASGLDISACLAFCWNPCDQDSFPKLSFWSFPALPPSLATSRVFSQNTPHV